jgi:hypothetical protein
MDGITIETLRRKIDLLLVESIAADLRSVDYRAPKPAETTRPLAELARAEVSVRHAAGAPDAAYRIAAFGDRLDMRIQVNVWRLVLVYSLRETPEMDAASLARHLQRWQAGAEHAGWRIGWRGSIEPDDLGHGILQIYCYANAARDLLDDPAEQLFWRTDIVQMTRALMLEAAQAGVRLAIDAAGERSFQPARP